ncbi:Pin2-interacting protein X1 [Strigomonas culicis]|uniref:PinX1-related protein 1 n=1 Tax=Strigomonas culicis TaxID=28005 RepID=S9WFJ6_9TRYP|nr:Pin2-interacting protein X1 [Strigomonas culicis]EPY34515.1 Pin2-interacting protein X1 [Strigomonas culicis]|eukprot:EPY24744.1 Pin2-interacting protein X1 [Strigomonas culicis]
MSSDPNGTRWSKSNTFGKEMLRKSGWTEGAGIGKEQDGTATHVKVSRKDDVLGLGYTAGVQETWSTQSVGFVDVLSRIKASHSGTSKKKADMSGDSDGEGEGHVESPTADTAPTHSRHYKMYAKRNALKTELLRAGDGDNLHRGEILGSAASHLRKHKRGSGDDDSDDEREGKASRKHHKEEEGKTTLKSPLLLRVTQRYPKHEPRPHTDDSDNRVTITKPHPRPPKCTESPFLLS